MLSNFIYGFKNPFDYFVLRLSKKNNDLLIKNILPVSSDAKTQYEMQNFDIQAFFEGQKDLDFYVQKAINEIQDKKLSYAEKYSILSIFDSAFIREKNYLAFKNLNLPDKVNQENKEVIELLNKKAKVLNHQNFMDLYSSNFFLPNDYFENELSAFLNFYANDVAVIFNQMQHTTKCDVTETNYNYAYYQYFNNGIGTSHQNVDFFLKNLFEFLNYKILFSEHQNSFSYKIAKKKNDALFIYDIVINPDQDKNKNYINKMIKEKSLIKIDVQNNKPNEFNVQELKQLLYYLFDGLENEEETEYENFKSFYLSDAFLDQKITENLFGKTINASIQKFKEKQLLNLFFEAAFILSLVICIKDKEGDKKIYQTNYKILQTYVSHLWSNPDVEQLFCDNFYKMHTILPKIKAYKAVNNMVDLNNKIAFYTNTSQYLETLGFVDFCKKFIL